MSNSLDQLATASSLMDMLKELKEGMWVLREDVNRLKTYPATTGTFYCNAMEQ